MRNCDVIARCPNLGGDDLNPGGPIQPVPPEVGLPADVQSGNWAGLVSIADNNNPVTSVQAAWIHPAVTATPNTDTYASFWVGLNGGHANNPYVCQIGTLAQIENGVTTHYAWWENYPDDEIPIGVGAVAPGDVIFARVDFTGNRSYDLFLNNLSQNWHYSGTVNGHYAGASPFSAEVIAEAFGVGNQQSAPLADFGSIDFGACFVNDAPLANAPNLERPTMVRRGMNNAIVTRAEVTAMDETEFTVTWRSN
ncbi:G1 family glutamic endopeptidase [Streptomyces sp. NPDC006879]|uniref:G1 family glutamic endopeptidase n=1 Tax=Streptomyces sp. NPDC006879 TaxID=3364767 RepID=UPI00368C6A23